MGDHISFTNYNQVTNLLTKVTGELAVEQERTLALETALRKGVRLVRGILEELPHGATRYELDDWQSDTIVDLLTEQDGD